MMIAVQRVGLVMVLRTAKTRLMDVISPAMIMTVVIVKVVVEPLAVAVKTAMTANMILLLTDPSAVIRPGMSMVLIVLH